MNHRNQPNIRTQFKNLIKNLDRGEITENDIDQWLRYRGILGSSSTIRAILKTSVKARIISRIGQAAKKKGLFIRLTSFRFPIDYHKTIFVKMITREIKETWEYLEPRKGFEIAYKLIKKEIIDHD